MPHRITRYFLTEYLASWAVYRDGEEVALVAENVASVEDALDLAVAHGKHSTTPFRVYYAQPTGLVVTLHDSVEKI